jgi:hypothetical protein
MLKNGKRNGKGVKYTTEKQKIIIKETGIWENDLFLKVVYEK